MSEHEATECTPDEGAEQETETWQNGLVTGIPGKNVGVNGVLDLRQVPAEEIAAVASIRINGVILMDQGNRNALSGVDTQINGTVIVADPDLRLIVEPDIVFSRAAVEAMPAGQKLMLVGNVFFKPDVPPDSIAEKFDRLHIIGIVLACEGVYGALMGKMERTGISIALPQDVGEVIRSVGHSAWTRDYISRLADGVTYVNIGATSIPDDMPVDLIDRKIAAYHNVGQTTGPEPILALLKSRCTTNMGEFSPQDSDESEEKSE
jgi:hypothetical protein